MQYKVASYFRHGRTMSRSARTSHKNNEHPITHWIKTLAIDKELIKDMLVFAGIRRTGMYAQRTEFYRLPRWHSENELARFYKTFNKIPVTKRKCIDYMTDYLKRGKRLTPVKEKEKISSRFPRRSPERAKLNNS